MNGLLAFSRAVDAVNTVIGRSAAWLILGSILVSAGNALMAWAFSLTSNAWLELQWYLFTAAFMLAAPYTLLRNEHIRIDVVTGRFSKRTRDWIDVFGHTFMLLPFAAIMVWLCWTYFWNSYSSGEVSGSANGLTIWPIRLVIFIGFVLLLLQGFSELIKRIAIIRGDMEDPHPSGGHGPHAPPETMPDASAKGAVS